MLKLSQEYSVFGCSHIFESILHIIERFKYLKLYKSDFISHTINMKFFL